MPSSRTGKMSRAQQRGSKYGCDENGKKLKGELGGVFHAHRRKEEKSTSEKILKGDSNLSPTQDGKAGQK